MGITGNCHLLRASLLEHLESQLAVEQIRDLCVITLPIQTIDGRLIDVFVEQKVGGYVLVHDGGKAANELIIHGLELTPSVNKHCAILAGRLGVRWEEESFQHSCKAEQLSATAMAIGNCSSLAMMHLIGFVVQQEQEPIRDQFRTALRKWGSKRKVKISDNVKVAGGIKQHRFDFVAYSKIATVAISILSPAVSSISAADRFALKSIDLKGTSYSSWKPMAVQTHAEDWSDEASEIVKACSSAVLRISSGECVSESRLNDALTLLLAA